MISQFSHDDISSHRSVLVSFDPAIVSIITPSTDKHCSLDTKMTSLRLLNR